ncbi:hypothetical protein [Clostridium sp. CCUG 7971]|uniref:hypothetical protein n=1 Tax=Clostridium sp. CCUG 7971 TaxID=2811414 RepID=UPI001ABA390B|nr:hypothetical protein [Clostridium sp. CCUG 7971]MBO3444590.1 hypothetical protein [Clostridium sp. CCUG 7971]
MKFSFDYNTTKIVIFESKISDEHINFMENTDKLVLWADKNTNRILGSKKSLEVISKLGIILK